MLLSHSLNRMGHTVWLILYTLIYMIPDYRRSILYNIDNLSMYGLCKHKTIPMAFLVLALALYKPVYIKA